MKNLKVGVNPRYLLQSREGQSRGSTIGTTSPKGKLNDFEDLNLHKLTPYEQQ